MSDDETRELPPVAPEEARPEAETAAPDDEAVHAGTTNETAETTEETTTVAFESPAPSGEPATAERPTSLEETTTELPAEPPTTPPTSERPTTPLPPIAPVPDDRPSPGPTTYGAPPATGPATSYATGHIRVTSATQPAPPAPEPRQLRVGTVVWGLVVAAVGVGLLSLAWGAHLDAELALIVLLGAAGVALLVGSLVAMRRSRKRLEGRG